MGDRSAIEWTDATWNPIVGCSIVSPGCTNCYAMAMAARIQKMNRTGGSNSNYINHYDGTTKVVNGNVVWTGKVAPAPYYLFEKPLSWKRPRRIFVNSMGDLFHESIPDEWIDRVFAVMALCPQHTFQILTKRAERMRNYCSALAQGKRNISAAKELRGSIIGAITARASLIKDNPVHIRPLPNVWLGVSAERQQEADERIPLLLRTPAAVRFVSLEPLLGAIDLVAIDRVPDMAQSDALWGDRIFDDGSIERGAKLDWVIVGGESGSNARPMHPGWARKIRDDCADAGVPFFFKQWGDHQPAELMNDGRAEPWRVTADGETMWALDELGKPREALPQVAFHRVGKKAAGRLLDGVEHNEFPGHGAAA